MFDRFHTIVSRHPSAIAGGVAAVAIVGLLVPFSLDAQPPIAPPPSEIETQVVQSKTTAVTPAASVKFRRDLNLPFPTLSTLGARIDAARRAGDPVALANAASELGAAEAISGRTTGLTARQVLGEAAELARLRRQDAELKAVLQVTERVALEEERIADLKRLLKLKRIEIQDVEQNNEPNGPRRIVVNNHTTQYIDVQANGYLQAQVLPNTKRVFVIDALWNPLVLKGWGDSDETTFGPVILKGRFTNYTWNINADDAKPYNVLP